MEQTGHDEDDVVFLDDDVFLDGEVDDLDDGAWLAEERIETGSDPRVLPPRASRSRLLVTLAALALFIGGTGMAFTTAYHRHVTDVRIANLLKLAPGAYPPQIPDLPSLAFAANWHAQVNERVNIPVMNESPRPIVLLGAVLSEPGMVGDARLAPTGPATLATGQTGTVSGTVTVNCAQPLAGGLPTTESDPSFVIPVQPIATLKVRARTSGGRVAEVAFDPEASQSYESELQQRICLQQGDSAVSGIAETTRYDPVRHVVTLEMSVRSNADTALWYDASLDYSPHARGVAVPCSVESVQSPTPEIGTLRPGASLDKTFLIQTSSCPVGTLAAETQQLSLTVEVWVHGNPIDAETNVVPLQYSGS